MGLASETNIVSTLKRPYFGPFLLGLVFCGIPFAIVFSRLDGDVDSPNLLGDIAVLTPFAALVAAIGSAYDLNGGWKKHIARAFAASLGACFPVPFVVLTLLELPKWGGDIIRPEVLPTLTVVLVLWAILSAVPGWVVGMLVVYLRRAWAKHSTNSTQS